MIPGFGPPTSVAVSMLGVELKITSWAPRSKFLRHNSTSQTRVRLRRPFSITDWFRHSTTPTEKRLRATERFRVNGDPSESLRPVDLETLGLNGKFDSTLQDYFDVSGIQSRYVHDQHERRTRRCRIDFLRLQGETTAPQPLLHWHSAWDHVSRVARHPTQPKTSAPQPRPPRQTSMYYRVT